MTISANTPPGPVTHESVVAEIVRAVHAFRPSFPRDELNGDTHLVIDLGLESASRIELLLEVERALDIALDIGAAAVFADLTIAELAALIRVPPDTDVTPYPAWSR